MRQTILANLATKNSARAYDIVKDVFANMGVHSTERVI